MRLTSITKMGGEAATPLPRALTEEIILPGAPAALPSKPGTVRRLATLARSPVSAARGMGFGIRSIIGSDERTRIHATEEAPWRMICALEIASPWGDFIGTGWFAGPRTIITAGHCVFDRAQMGGWASTITVTPGRDGAEKPFGQMRATKFSSTDAWIERQDPDFDVAAIHLPADAAVPADIGWFGVAAYPNDKLTGMSVNVSGYPGDRGDGTEQWWARNRIHRLAPRRIFYDVDTMGGQSGAPVYVLPDARTPPVVIGVHAYGVGGSAAAGQDLNSGPRMIPELTECIAGWIAADAG
ncbi:V8-like Glu-specific endopeptidase [Sphingobium sp. OAS761]|uniref:trypsin-like serine peptidase n=1 Tax=Sphingobium sp. OAS761 TaxID=2817901 RepID=UPI00209E4B9A|nr:trypsin-like peptidase domain-containing protein [Sphingobium sp. OAS761]MCP1469030.1 V8-like Glu-specific endopeptidase [Sphingobium sp. OAS761]